MGLCLSKKQRRRDEQPCGNAVKKKSGKRAGKEDAALVPEVKKAPTRKAEEPAADKRTVFVVKAAAAAAAAEVAAEANGEGAKAVPAPAAEDAKPAAVSRVPVRTSSCTKEEVDAILIQCGRLSRSSSASGKASASGESGGGHHRYSGSKRSYDFDREKRGGGVDDECDWERHGAAAVSRPSPRRRTPERKRSASHERTSGGGGNGSRRVSRSPGRRGDAAPAAVSSAGVERVARPPGKMVSVPAREKGRAPSPVKRYPSPTLRSNSPARAAAVANENAGVQPTHGPSLSRSSSRKADHSPYRRNPMSELDENTLVNKDENTLVNNQHSNNSGKPRKKPMESAAVVPQKLAERAKEQAPSCRISKEKPEIVEEAVASLGAKAPSARMNATHIVSIVAESVVNPRDRSWRRSSRDFDLEDAVASDTKAVAPSSRMKATHSVSIVADPKAAGPTGRSSRRASRDFDHNNGSSNAFLDEAATMASDIKAPSSRMNATHSVSIVAESVANNPKAAGRSSRRSSRDFDHNGNSYASLLLEDIQSYHQQKAGDAAAPAPAFSLPACVSKACSILEAVADLNSSSEEDRSFELDRSADDMGSINVSCYSGKGPATAGTHVVESEVVVKDDLTEPSLHKYVSVRDIEPQESAGSNSFAGNPWTRSSWEPNSVDSTGRTWTVSQSDDSDDDVEDRGTVSTLEQSWQSEQEPSACPRIGSASNAQLGRGAGAHRDSSSVLTGRSDVRTVSVNSSIA